MQCSYLLYSHHILTYSVFPVLIYYSIFCVLSFVDASQESCLGTVVN